MLLFIHLSAACISILLASLNLFRLTRKRFTAQLVMTGLTIVSGISLAISTQASLGSTCITGLIYLSAMAFSVKHSYKLLTA